MLDAAYEEQNAFAKLIKKCGVDRNLHQARHVHARVLASRHALCVFLTNLIIEMYGKCGSVKEAMQAFESVEYPNFYSWNILMCAFMTDRTTLPKAKLVFEKMPQWDVQTWTALMAGYGKFSFLDESSSIFERMPSRNEVTWNTMVTIYSHCGHLDSAISAFDLMPCRGPVVWNAVLSTYAQLGNAYKARDFFDQMPIRDFTTWTNLFQAYANGGHLRDLCSLHDRMPQWDVVSCTGLLSAYVLDGKIEEARSMFDAMPEPDTVAWNAMLAAYAQTRQLAEAKEVFETMPSRDVVSWTTVCLAHAQQNCIAYAAAILDKMPARDLYICNGMIASYAQEKDVRRAEELFFTMPEKTVISWTAMIVAYAQNGCIREARCLFNEMDMPRDTVAWNAIINGYARSPTLVSEMFGLMNLEGQMPNDVTFLSALSACCDGGCIENAWNFFVWMVADFGIAPIKDHYNLVMTVLCRAGRLESAEDLFQHMPFLPDAIGWGTLLSSYKLHQDVDRAAMAGECVLASSSDRSSYYVLLASTWEDGMET